MTDFEKRLWEYVLKRIVEITVEHNALMDRLNGKGDD